jgi:hypothetical protein
MLGLSAGSRRRAGLRRFRFGAVAGSFAADELASAGTYGVLLVASGGKFTDSLERDAEPPPARRFGRVLRARIAANGRSLC